jgi:hypothetical protein
MLIYETDDYNFANSAVEALREAGIDAYRTGGVVEFKQPAGLTTCVHIRDAADFQKANGILIKLGAVTEDPNRFLPKWLLVLFAVIAVLLGFWISSEWK